MLCGKSSCLVGVGHRAYDRETQLARRQRSHGDISPAARLSVGIKQLITADRIDNFRRAGDQMVDGIGIVLTPP